MKKTEIFIDYTKVEEKDFKKVMQQFRKEIFQGEKRKESAYKKMGFNGLVMNYVITGDKLNEKEFIYLAIDYIARICWAFHNQRQIDFLSNYKKVFFDLKINKVTEKEAGNELFNYEQNNRTKAHDLFHLLGWCSDSYEKQKFDSDFWCDGLIVKEDSSVKNKIGIIYQVNDDYKLRALCNPLKISLFNRMQLIEHIESLNLIFFLAYNKIEKEADKINFIKTIDNSWEYFINNKKVTDTPQESNEHVYRLVNES